MDSSNSHLYWQVLQLVQPSLPPDPALKCISVCKSPVGVILNNVFQDCSQHQFLHVLVGTVAYPGLAYSQLWLFHALAVLVPTLPQIPVLSTYQQVLQTS